MQQLAMTQLAMSHRHSLALKQFIEVMLGLGAKEDEEHGFCLSVQLNVTAT